MSQSKPNGAPASADAANARRSTRVFTPVSLRVLGQNKLGSSFIETTSAVAVNCHGCLYPSRHEYRPGSWVTLEIPGGRNEKPHPVRAQVRFIRLPRNPRELYQVGVELETPANVWGIDSPPEDWRRFPGALSLPATTAKSAAPAETPAAAPRPKLASPPAPPASRIPGGAPASAVPGPPPPAVRGTAAARNGVSAEPQEDLLRGLDARIQQAAQKAVASVVASQLNAAVHHAAKAIENFSQATLRRVEEYCQQQREKLAAAAHDEAARKLQAEIAQAGERLRQQTEAFLAQARETARQLDEAAGRAQPVLAEARRFLETATQDLPERLSASLRETAGRAAAEFSQEAARLADERLRSFAGQAQAAADEAAARMDARSAEARLHLETAAGTALAELDVVAKKEIERIIGDGQREAAASLTALAAEARGELEARQRSLRDELARTERDAVGRFRQRLAAILNASVAAAAAAAADGPETEATTSDDAPGTA